MSSKKLTVDPELEALQRKTPGYLLHETDPVNGLVIDETDAGHLRVIDTRVAPGRQAA